MICGFKDKIVVIVPAPEIKGKATGTIVDAFDLFSCFLIILRPKIISIASINKIIPPATANEDCVTPKKESKRSPKNNAKSIIINDVIDAFSA